MTRFSLATYHTVQNLYIPNTMGFQKTHKLMSWWFLTSWNISVSLS